MWVFVCVSVCFEAGIRIKTGLLKLYCFEDPEVETEREEMSEEKGMRKPRAVQYSAVTATCFFQHQVKNKEMQYVFVSV